MPEATAGTADELTGEVLAVRVDRHDPAAGEIDLDTTTGSVVRCRGPLAGLIEGERVTLVGTWHERPGDGRMFEALGYTRRPAVGEGVDRLVSSARFDHIPLRDRRRIVTTFGAGAGRVIDHEPSRLVTEAGLDPEVASELHGAWAADRALIELVRLVAPAGWSLDLARCVHEGHGRDAVGVARHDPYALIGRFGVRFAHADALARHLGTAADDDRRLAAGARAVIAAAQRRDGHVHLTRREAITTTARLLGTDALLATAGVEHAVSLGELATESLDGVPVVSTPDLLAAEHRLVAGILRLTRASPSSSLRTGPGDLPTPELSAAQRAAVDHALAEPVSVLTGTAGTGTEAVVAALTRLGAAAGSRVVVCAASAGAAAHLGERIGRPVSVVDRFIARGRTATDAPGELVIAVDVDRYDTPTTAGVVDAVATGSRLVLVGDPQQLPTRAPGAVLHDLVVCGRLPVTELTEVRPDEAHRRVVTLAQEVLAGTVGALPPVAGDVFVAAEPRTASIVARVVRAVIERVPFHLGVDPVGVAVLAPGTGGPAGTDAIAAALAARRPGGAATATIEAAAGGSWPVVVLVCDTTQRSSLSRHSLYTAVTRAQQALIIVGQPEVVREAAAHEQRVVRDTGLTWLLRSKLGPGAERTRRAAGPVA